MRALKRWFHNWQDFRSARPQLSACYPHVASHFGGPVTWRHTGGCGRDVVCLVARDGRPVGVLRVTLPGAKLLIPPTAGLPFVSLPAATKIEREWFAYTAGFEQGLTPQPLWRDGCSMLCAYVDAQPLKRMADEGEASPLALATAALPHIARLHAAGLTHMDMSLSNILYDRSQQRHFFVDFEYGPAEGLTVEQQCLYDYLRLLESIWKFLSPAERAAAAGTWGQAFQACASVSVRAAELAPLRPALGRILAAPELRSLFDGLARS